MGSLKVGDKIIVTKILGLPDYANMIGIIKEVDNGDTISPYLVKIEKREFWCDGMEYTPLMAELQ